MVTASGDDAVKVWDASPIEREFLTREPAALPGAVK